MLNFRGIYVVSKNLWGRDCAIQPIYVNTKNSIKSVEIWHSTVGWKTRSDFLKVIHIDLLFSDFKVDMYSYYFWGFLNVWQLHIPCFRSCPVIDWIVRELIELSVNWLISDTDKMRGTKRRNTSFKPNSWTALRGQRATKWYCFKSVAPAFRKIWVSGNWPVSYSTVLDCMSKHIDYTFRQPRVLKSNDRQRIRQLRNCHFGNSQTPLD